MAIDSRVFVISLSSDRVDVETRLRSALSSAHSLVIRLNQPKKISLRFHHLHSFEKAPTQIVYGVQYLKHCVTSDFMWQVDEAFLQATQSSSSSHFLFEYIKGIQSSFGIDWPSVKWEDMRMSLYSALGARLYIALTVSPAPNIIEAP